MCPNSQKHLEKIIGEFPTWATYNLLDKLADGDSLLVAEASKAVDDFNTLHNAYMTLKKVDGADWIAEKMEEILCKAQELKNHYINLLLMGTYDFVT
jgi:hypothetical protein